jgi:hypothetical protein
MVESILTSTKKVLGIAEAYTAFDTDIITHINSTFSILVQLGVGPLEGFMIADATEEWADFDVSQVWLNLIRSYVFLKVRHIFDPPGTSFLLDAMQKQIQEFEWRLSTFREEEAWTAPI